MAQATSMFQCLPTDLERHVRGRMMATVACFFNACSILAVANAESSLHIKQIILNLRGFSQASDELWDRGGSRQNAGIVKGQLLAAFSTKRAPFHNWSTRDLPRPCGIALLCGT